MVEQEIDVLCDAAGLLADDLDAAADLEVVDRFRVNVWRVAVRGGSRDVPPTVIVRAGPDRVSDPRSQPGDGLRWHEVFANEVAGTRFLAELTELEGRVPVELAGDVDRQVLVSQDLGTGPSVADVLLADDRDRALALLEQHAAMLGDVASASFGKTDRYAVIRSDCGPPASPHNLRPTGGAALHRFLDGFARDVGVVPADDVDDEVARIVSAAATPPSDWTAYSPADACPDNNVVTEDGRLAMFDFGYGAVRHLGLDTTYFSLPFPTCWCYAPLPQNLRSHLLETYRTAVGQRVPAVRDDDAWTTAVAWAAAAWFIDWIVAVAIAEDTRERQRGPLSGKAAVASQVATVAEVIAPVYGALSELASRTAASLQARWGITEVPTYPALR